MTLKTALEQGTKLLQDSAVAAPRLTAEVLLAHALQRDRVWLYAHSDDDLTELAWIHYGRYLHQRMSGVPTQYITRRQEFYGRDFCVTPDVLIPRPETEHLVSAALDRLTPDQWVADIGTGSGAIAVTLALESRLRVVAADVSVAALGIARRNAAALGAQVSLAMSDLLSAFAAQSLDAVVSNPPYVSTADCAGLQTEVRDHEPHLALFAGEDGNAMYRRLIEDAPRVLRPGGWILLELGYRSLDAVQAMLGRGWAEVSAEGDLAGIPRVLAARWAP